MARLSPKIEVIRALLARSGNQCAYPGCVQPLFSDSNKFIGQVCHIEAANPDGERYNASQTDEQRRAYENLMLLCYPHHIETNDVAAYPVERLRIMKFEHEALFEKSDFKIDESALHRLIDSMEIYRNKIERLNTLEHSMSELAVDINAKGTFFEVITSARENLGIIKQFCETFHEADNELEEDFNRMLEMKGIEKELYSDVPYYENPFINRNWELHNLGIPNRIQKLDIDLMHIEIKYLEEYLKTNSTDRDAKSRLKTLQESFAELAQHAICLD